MKLRFPIKPLLILLIISVLMVFSLPGEVGAENLGASHFHTGWVTYEVREYIKITSSEIHAQVDYWQDANGVPYGPEYVKHYCYDSAFPGWDQTRCSWYTMSSSGSAGIDVIGAFDCSWCSVNWEQEARWTAFTDSTQGANIGTLELWSAWGYWCWMNYGSLPWFWTQECSGFRFP